MTEKPIVYILEQDGGILDDTTISVSAVPAIIVGDGIDMKKIPPVLQKQGIAVLSLNSLDICKKYALDGVYYTEISPNTFKGVRRDNPELQLGVFCGNSRHTGMVVGESGADFVVFNCSQCVSWWFQMMEVCVVHDITNAKVCAVQETDFVLKPYETR